MFSTLENAVAEEKPDAVILIDYPGFNLRFAKKLKKYNIPVKNILKIKGSFLNTSTNPIIAISESVKYCFCPNDFKFIPPVPENSAFGYIFNNDSQMYLTDINEEKTLKTRKIKLEFSVFYHYCTLFLQYILLFFQVYLMKHSAYM